MKIKKKPNVARKSGYKPEEIGPALRSFGQVKLEGQSVETKSLVAETKEQQLRLKAAGYVVVLKPSA